MALKFHISSSTLPALAMAAALSGCASVGALMSPYSEKFDCKNDDHGQCIHPERAYEDAVAGARSKSDPAVTNDKKMLRSISDGVTAAKARGRTGATAYGSYKDSVYHELKGLIDAPVTPMLRPARTVRTLILPYADRQRPDRLYMPRYIYSVLDKPTWVVGGALVASPARAPQTPILSQVKEASHSDASTPAIPVTEPRS
ncbi:TraV family lipoprotein [Sphingopyxis sp. P1IMeth2]|uniref:TraV family lipoprotein n=1 Tax=Sphingopyxis sp. P1IMeth2 TaxID=1892848 RepID=UPI0016490902|nr:TraV family lipoprotein [Sphingopyxis sp. P1IMeth2]